MPELLLPLFPLKVVLFPRTNLALHIFEERYKEMIGKCLESQSLFGVVLAGEQSVKTTGCSASISEVVRRYDDGRMDIRVRGERRFEILLLDEGMPYLRGSAHFFADEGETVAADDQRRQQAMALYERVTEMLELETPNPNDSPPAPDDAELSFQLMARLPADIDFKQNLLQLRSESERLALVVPYMEKMAQFLEQVVKTRSRARGNGHRS